MIPSLLPFFPGDDTDGGGIPNVVEKAMDVDEDGILDHLDTDDDGDGIPDLEENTWPGPAPGE